jgi:transcriptional regulator with XRE-family HTH domain
VFEDAHAGLTLATESDRNLSLLRCIMPFLNIIGPVVIKLRFERGWSQEVLAARLQCQEGDVSRDVVANIESGRQQITDKHIRALQKAFEVPVVRLFPKTVQDLDEKFALRMPVTPKETPRQRRHYNRR